MSVHQHDVRMMGVDGPEDAASVVCLSDHLDLIRAREHHPRPSFLAHNPSGNFCYGFYPHAPYPGYPRGDRPAGGGERYRATVIGPGVLPDIGWEAPAIGGWNPSDPALAAYEQQMNALSDSLRGDDKLCRQH